MKNKQKELEDEIKETIKFAHSCLDSEKVELAYQHRDLLKAELKGRQEATTKIQSAVMKEIENVDTQYPDDDGEPFEVLACDYKKELIKRLNKLFKNGRED